MGNDALKEFLEPIEIERLSEEDAEELYQLWKKRMAEDHLTPTEWIRVQYLEMKAWNL